MTKNLYDPSFEHDACGVGMVADLSATPSNATILDALTILENLEHRGASGSDVDSGDGAGVLIQMPDAFIRAEFGSVVPPAGEYGVAHWMVPKGPDVAAVREAIDAVLTRVGLTSLGWRDVPVDSSVLGPTSLASEPSFVQQLIAKDPARPRAGPRTRAVLRAQGDRAHHRHLRVVVLPARADLQGDADVAAAAPVLQRPARRATHVGDRRRAQSVLHQRPAALGPRPTLPLHRPQRRNQHRPGQPELDDRARDLALERRLAVADLAN